MGYADRVLSAHLMALEHHFESKRPVFAGFIRRWERFRSENERYGMWAEARRYSALMLAALMIGHHLSISALWWA